MQARHKHIIYSVLKFAAVLVLFVFQAFLVAAEEPTQKMSLGTHSALIQKLEASLNGSSQLTKNSTLHRRLADLYAERARLQQMEEIKSGCTTIQCSKSKQDRVDALKHYELALVDAAGDGRSTMMIQKGYLHESLEQNAKALKMYDQVIREGRRKHPSALLGSAYAGRAEINYRKAEFNKAYRDYQNAMNISDTPHKGQIQYRMGWCKLNTGNLKSAQGHLENILTHRSEYKVDTSFHEDVSRDLASFYARGSIGPREIEKLKELAPQGQQVTILRHLAEETDRLGNKKASIYVWGLIPIDEKSPFERAEKLLQTARLHYESGQKELAAQEMKQASQVWNGQECQKDNSEKCESLKGKIRDFVINWNKGSKIEPDKHLLSAYMSYLAIFSQDYEMHYWAGQLARELKNFNLAADCFRNAAFTGKAVPKILQGALLNQIEVAESTNSMPLKLRSYQDYLDLSPQGQHAFKINYQIAHIKYEEKAYADAAARFFQLASSARVTTENKTLQIQAADLALDALAAIGDDTRLEQWGQKLGNAIPSKRAEYYSIARKANLNATAKLLKSGTVGDLRQAREKIKEFPLAGMKSDEKVAYAKNTMVLGEKSKDVALVRQGATALRQAAQTIEDKELALSRLVWCFEMELDFAQALKLAQHAGFPEISKSQRALKLAILSEFSGQNPTRYYSEALAHSKDGNQSAIIRQKLVRSSKRPWLELNSHKSQLAKYPEVYAESLFETFARDPNTKLAVEALKSKKVLNTVYGQRLARVLDLNRLGQLRKQVASHRIQKGSDVKMAQTLAERVQYLETLDMELQRASEHQDWSRQLLVLAVVEKENHRLGQEIASFPVPAILKKDQRQKYRDQLAQQSQKYLTLGAQAASKREEFLSDSKALKTLENVYINSDYPYKSLVRMELKTLHDSLPQNSRGKIIDILGESRDLPSQEEVLRAKHRVRSEPFNTSYLADYKEIMEQTGKHEYATYLSTRLEKLNSQGSRL